MTCCSCGHALERHELPQERRDPAVCDGCARANQPVPAFTQRKTKP